MYTFTYAGLTLTELWFHWFVTSAHTHISTAIRPLKMDSVLCISGASSISNASTSGANARPTSWNYLFKSIASLNQLTHFPSTAICPLRTNSVCFIFRRFVHLECIDEWRKRLANCMFFFIQINRFTKSAHTLPLYCNMPSENKFCFVLFSGGLYT